MDVGAPFPRPRILLEGSDGIVDIEKLGELAVLLLDRLRQIDRLGVALERIDDRLRHFRNMQRGGFLELEDRNAGIDELLQRLRDILVFDRLMADVVHDAEMAAQRRICFRDRNMRELGEFFDRGAGIQMIA